MPSAGTSQATAFAAAEKINVPGPLVRHLGAVPGSRNFMTQDQQYVYIPPATKDGYGYYRLIPPEPLAPGERGRQARAGVAGHQGV